ncbi:unnamed protein product [Ceratitis capitata]|uniref:(Mediterranean fruit fly) hypothetical protein n=1 Tax=Ceratitis capitata TaxID=7213 RepID=A0A811V7S5_CERCA|nr:unnamed protein product [Ceratitis capitata]
MPFYSRDWRSPGEAWVKTDEGWVCKKVLECGKRDCPSKGSFILPSIPQPGTFIMTSIPPLTLICTHCQLHQSRGLTSLSL